MNTSFATLIPAEQGKITPWKNGRGQSREIAIEPKEAEFSKNDFLWRLSSAQVLEAGDFSHFPGYNRWLTLVEGKELLLHVNDGEEMAALRAGENFSFMGKDAVKCEIPRGPIKDLGLIYKDGAVAAEMNTVKFIGRVRSFQLQSRTVFFYVLSGGFALSVFPGEQNFSLNAGDVLRVDPAGSGEERIVLCAPSGQGSLVAIELDW